jgi:hypothetical protein
MCSSDTFATHKPESGNPGAGLFHNPVNLTSEERNELLARGLPALTLPTGGHEGGNMFRKLTEDRVLDMNSTIGEWPSDRESVEWLHNDLNFRSEIKFSTY